MCIEFYFWTCEARALSLARSSRTTLFSDLFKQISLIGCRLALGLACQGRRQRTNIHIATNKNFSFLSYFRRIVWSSLSPRRAHTLSISHLTYTYFRWNFVYLFSFGWSKGTTNRHSTDSFCRLTNWNRSLNKPPTKKQRYKKKSIYRFVSQIDTEDSRARASDILEVGSVSIQLNGSFAERCAVQLCDPIHSESGAVRAPHTQPAECASARASVVLWEHVTVLRVYWALHLPFAVSSRTV